MQRWLSLLSVVALMLAGLSHGYAEEGADGEKPVPSTPEILTQKTDGGAPQQNSVPARRACLILPLQSDSFAKLAEPVRDGFLAARSNDGEGAISVQVYGTGDAQEDALTAYRQALADECSAVVGPLTRNAVTALAKSELVAVPTLALNMPETDATEWPKQLYAFGIQVEAEARQAARYAYGEGKRRAMTVSAPTPLSKRMEQSFVEEWNALGGVVAGDVALPAGKQIYPGLREEIAAGQPDLVFLALDGRRARQARPYIGNGMPVYATSQVYGSRDGVQRNVDLNGVRFVDMPWLLQPDHPAVMVYTRPEGVHTLDMERMYALGIDAYRIVNILLSTAFKDGAVLDGVTGRVTLGANRLFTRALPLAEFKQGEPLPVAQAKAE